MHFFWPEQGWHHAQAMLHDELAHVSEHFARSALVQEPGRSARWLIEHAYDWMFVKSGLLDWIRDAAAQSRAGAGNTAHDFRYYLGQVYVHVESYLIASAYTVLVFLVRLLVLTLTLPLFLMTAFVGFVDGLVRRDVRRFGAGRESGFLYHRARATLMPLAVLPWVTYLALPVSVHPLLILLPSAALLGVAVDVASATFKKYL
jgi:integrating conjugative element membrane protein (TIGR03747 family)